MNELQDSQGLTFRRFVKQVYPVASSQRDSGSFINSQKKFRTLLGTTQTSELSLNEKEIVHCFDESYLLPISDELGITPIKTLKLIALRNAWITYFQRSEIPQTLLNETGALMANEIAKDYILLTSSNWAAHTWIQEQINSKESYVSFAELRYHEEWEDGIASMKNDINFVIGNFKSHVKNYSNDIEKDADFAKNDIKRAQNTIRELRGDIKKQEAIIEEAMRPVAKHQYRRKLSKKNLPGHPKLSDNKELQERHDIAKEFVAMWIGSLKNNLEIESYDDLAKYVTGSKFTWWRWSNKKNLPGTKSLRPLLDEKIKKTGKYQGKKLCEIQTSPSLLDLITLVDLV